MQEPQRSLIDIQGDSGPFDLLLELIREKALDVSALSLREITNDFLTYIKTRPIRPELLGDFLVVAATLLLIKVRQFLPQLEEQEEEEVEQLTARLSVYRQYREQGQYLAQQWDTAPLLSAGAFAPDYAAGSGALTVGVAQLMQAMETLTQRLPKPIEVRAHLRPRGKSLQECLELFASRLAQLKTLVFQQVVSESPPEEIAISFLAVLELARQQQVQLHQPTFDSELTITRV